MTTNPAAQSSYKGHLADEIMQDSEVTTNLGQKIISTTEDKIKLAVVTHLSRIEQRRAWHAPAGILITIATALATTEFKQAYFPAATWQAVFLLCGIASLVWTVRTAYRAFNAPTMEDFVQALRPPQK
jgi:Flp pilus assembly protein TadB